MAERDLPTDIRARNRALALYLDTVDPTDEQGRRIGQARCGIYAFFDFDGEPIYVGQTTERVSSRIRRHLTNQRTDAVAMHVLDPLEVAEVEVWPFWRFQLLYAGTEDWRAAQRTMNAAERVVYDKVIQDSPIGRVLNEMEPPLGDHVELPPSVRGGLVPPELRERLGHPDDRIARRAQTIANLSTVTKERDVSLGLRNTLVTQAERLLRLARARRDDVAGHTPATVIAAETVGLEAERVDGGEDEA